MTYTLRIFAQLLDMQSTLKSQIPNFFGPQLKPSLQYMYSTKNITVRTRVPGLYEHQFPPIGSVNVIFHLPTC